MKMFRTSGRDGALHLPRRVQRGQPRLAVIPRTRSTCFTLAGTSRCDVPAVVRHGGHPQGFKIKSLSQNAGKILKVNKGEYSQFKGKNSQIFISHFYGKSLRNQAKTIKKTAQNCPKNMRILNHFPRLLIIKQKCKPAGASEFGTADLDCGLRSVHSINRLQGHFHLHRDPFQLFSPPCSTS